MINILNKIDNFINKNFFDDYHNWILWLPVLFSFGIISYFEFRYYNVYLFYIIPYTLIFFMIKCKENLKTLITLFAFLIFTFGYMRSAIYTINKNSPTIKYKMGYVKIYGIIDDISYYQKQNQTKKRLIVKVNKIEKHKKIDKNERIRDNMTSYFTKDGLMHNLPKYLRVNINNKTYQPKFGDSVEIRANLIPNPKNVFQQSYDIEKAFYFEQIGGIAYNGYIYKFETPENQTFFEKLKNKTYNTRENINNRIINAIGEKNGSVVGSFITGIRGKISSENYNNMTYAGLAHLIAISGLNMAIVMGLAFSVIRRILAQSEYITLKYDIKKISSFFAIIFGFIYLSITGFPVSANRAYIMSLLYFVGIIIERETDTMRFLTLAGIIILFNEPNLVLNASFQLSFFAVIGLVSGFKYLKSLNISTYTTKIWLKPLYYLFAIIISSIITEISVTPLAIYHFNNYTPYNMIANMIAIPLTGFITLPFTTFSIFLFPFNLEKILLIPAGWSMEIILKISEYIVNLKTGVHIVSSPSILGITFIIFGFLWFALWEQKWRYFGILLFTSGIIFSIFKKVPNVIIDQNDKFIVLISKNGDLYFSENKNNYKVSVIKKKFGEIEHKKLTQYCEFFNDKENCLNFVKEVDYIFRNKDIIENFRHLNNKYKIMDKELYVAINS